MVIVDVEQGTDAWFACRAGRATASEFSSVLAKGQGKTRASYMRRVIAERLMGKPLEDTYRNAHMDRGTEQEPLARMAYELLTDNIVQKVGFCQHDSLMAGCSPDGFVLDQPKGAEIKCVIPTVQVETILRGECPPEHKAQVQGNLWITGYETWDFFSFSPDLPEPNRTFLFTVTRDEDYINVLENEVRSFLLEADAKLKQLGLIQNELRRAA